MESRRLGRRIRKFAGPNSFRKRYGSLFPSKDRGVMVCVLAQEQGKPPVEGGRVVSNRQRHVGAIRFLAAAQCQAAKSILSRQRQTLSRAPVTIKTSFRQLRQRSRASGTLPPPPDRYDLSRRSSGWLVHLVGARSAIRGSPARCAELADGRAERGPNPGRSCNRKIVCFHYRQRQ